MSPQQLGNQLGSLKIEDAIKQLIEANCYATYGMGRIEVTPRENRTLELDIIELEPGYVSSASVHRVVTRKLRPMVAIPARDPCRLCGAVHA